MKTKIFLMRIFNILFSIIMVYLLKLSIFDAKIFKLLNPLIIIFFAILFVGLIYTYRKFINKVSDRNLKLISLFFLCIMFVLQAIVIKELSVNPSWDFEAVSTSAHNMATSGEITYLDYFKMYPNNLGITVILSLIYRLAIKVGFANLSYIIIGIILNVFVINLALLMGFVLVKRDKGLKAASLYSLIALFTTPLYMYAPIYYTDTLSMIYPILIFLLFFLYKKNNKSINLILISIIAPIGVLTKTNIIISIVALIIFILLNLKFKEFLKVSIFLIVGFGCINFGFNKYLSVTYNLDKSSIGFPATHWVMMGLNGSGGYNDADVDFTQNCKPEDRVSENIRVIKERVLEYGPKGMINHLNDKLKITWTDGTMFAPEKLRRFPKKEDSRLAQYIYGENNTIYLYASQMSYVVILIGILLSSLMSIRNKKTFEMQNLFNISIFGVFLFLLIWETRSRYLVCFLIVMLVSSVYGLENMFLKINKKK